MLIALGGASRKSFWTAVAPPRLACNYPMVLLFPALDAFMLSRIPLPSSWPRLRWAQHRPLD